MNLTVQAVDLCMGVLAEIVQLTITSSFIVWGSHCNMGVCITMIFFAYIFCANLNTCLISLVRCSAFHRGLVPGHPESSICECLECCLGRDLVWAHPAPDRLHT